MGIFSNLLSISFDYALMESFLLRRCLFSYKISDRAIAQCQGYPIKSNPCKEYGFYGYK